MGSLGGPAEVARLFEDSLSSLWDLLAVPEQPPQTGSMHRPPYVAECIATQQPVSGALLARSLGARGVASEEATGLGLGLRPRSGAKSVKAGRRRSLTGAVGVAAGEGLSEEAAVAAAAAASTAAQQKQQQKQQEQQQKLAANAGGCREGGEGGDDGEGGKSGEGGDGNLLQTARQEEKAFLRGTHATLEQLGAVSARLASQASGLVDARVFETSVSFVFGELGKPLKRRSHKAVSVRQLHKLTVALLESYETQPLSGDQGRLVHAKKGGSGKVVDFRQILFQLCRALPQVAVAERIRFFFDMYGSGEDGTISIGGLCALLYWGDRKVASSLQEADRFMRALDEDGDGTVTFKEFKDAVGREPLMLESLVRGTIDEFESDEHIKTVRTFIGRTSMTWRGMSALWGRLQRAGVKFDGDGGGGGGGGDVRCDTPVFETELFATLQPPAKEDGLLVRSLRLQFASDAAELDHESWVSAKAFVMAVSAVLAQLKVGISDSTDKGTFYFSLYNLDGDKELSREEIYNMLFSAKDALGARILRASNVLREIDVNNDDTISLQEFMEATERDPDLLHHFAPRG